jgi:hypothetical protein
MEVARQNSIHFPEFFMTDKAPAPTGALEIQQRKRDALAKAAEKEQAKLKKMADDVRARGEKQKANIAKARRSRAERQTREASKQEGRIAANSGTLSPAESFQMRKRNALAKAAADAEGKPAVINEDPEYTALRLQLSEDNRKLKAIESIEKKIEAKKPMFETYRPHIMARLKADEAVQDDIFSLMMLWAIDLAEYPLAILMGTHIIKHGLALPPNFVRGPATALVEQISEAALAENSTVSHGDLMELLDHVDKGKWDMLDPVKGKLFKAICKSYHAKATNYDAGAADNPTSGQSGLARNAIKAGQMALQLGGDKIGVKTDIREMERLLAKIDEDGGKAEQKEPEKKPAAKKTARKKPAAKKATAKPDAKTPEKAENKD